MLFKNRKRAEGFLYGVCMFYSGLCVFSPQTQIYYDSSKTGHLGDR